MGRVLWSPQWRASSPIPHRGAAVLQRPQGLHPRGSLGSAGRPWATHPGCWEPSGEGQGPGPPTSTASVSSSPLTWSSQPLVPQTRGPPALHTVGHSHQTPIHSLPASSRGTKLCCLVRTSRAPPGHSRQANQASVGTQPGAGQEERALGPREVPTGEAWEAPGSP